MLMDNKPPDPWEDVLSRWCKQCQKLTALKEWTLYAPSNKNWSWVHASCGITESIPERVQ